MKSLRIFSLLLLCEVLAVGQTAPTVKTQAGELQGVVERGIFAFKGIPYAAPPVGDLRWREPQPASSWQGVRKADRYGSACIQIPGLSAANGGDPGSLSEDCLYLNVWTPKLDAAAKLPVMVWIHGGAYIFGAGGMPIYDGGPLATKGAVVVNINYRLAQLGFFAHPALERERPNGSVNFGLLDQIAALQWVQQNIAQFGGDPANVTILGQSAGGKSVMALFASPLAHGLFQKGVAMSQYGIPDATRAKAIDVGSSVASALGLNGADATAAELRAVPAEKFEQLKDQGLSLSPVPISGDVVLPQSIQDTFDAGNEAPLPLIVGNTSDDASVITGFGVDPAKVIQSMRSAGMILKVLYPGVKGDKELGSQVVRDVVFTFPVKWVADRHSKLAHTWRYYFDYTAVKQRAKFPHGVPHGAEIVYALDTAAVYPDTKRVFTQQDLKYARRVSEYFFEFAKSGKPFCAGSAAWPNHVSGQDKTMHFGETIVVQTNFMKARMNVFSGASKLLGGMLTKK